MQKIWLAVFGNEIPYKVTMDGAVFAVVRIHFYCLRNSPHAPTYRPNNESQILGEVL